MLEEMMAVMLFGPNPRAPTKAVAGDPLVVAILEPTGHGILESPNSTSPCYTLFGSGSRRYYGDTTFFYPFVLTCHASTVTHVARVIVPG
jgi:hypothetical protein